MAPLSGGDDAVTDWCAGVSGIRVLLPRIAAERSEEVSALLLGGVDL